MITNRMLRHRISVTKLTQGSGMVRTRVQTASNVPALVLPMDEDSTTQYGISIGQAYKISTNVGVDISETDKITDNRGRVFVVRGKKDFEDFGRLNHLAFYCEMIGRVTEDAEESE